MPAIISACLDCEQPVEFESTIVGSEITCGECGHEQIALPESIRMVLHLIANVHSVYCKELKRICPEMDLEYRWPMTIEVGAYILLVLDFSMFYHKQTPESRKIVNRFGEEVVLPYDSEHFSKAIEHRLGTFGRALSGKPLSDGLTECHAILSNYLIAAPTRLIDVATSDIPLHVGSSTSAFQLRSSLVELELAVVVPFRRALKAIFSHSRDIMRVPGDVVEELILGAFEGSS